jgi:hypothetical protein
VTLDNNTKVNTTKLDEQIEAVVKEVYDIWDNIEERKVELRSKIKQWEFMLDEKMTLLGQDWAKKEICTIICKRIDKDAHPNYEELRMLVVNHVDKEHLRTVELSSLRSVESTDLPEECSIWTNRVLDGSVALRGKYPEHFGRRNFQDIAQCYHDDLNRLEKLAKQYGIPLPYVIESLPDEKKEKIRLKGADLSTQEKIRLAQKKSLKQWNQRRNKDDSLIESLTDKYNFVSEDFNTETENIFTEEALNSLYKPLSDDKWQRDWGEWCDILENYHEQGGTYASSKSAVDSTLIDEKTGKPKQRKITKEQIDASHDEYLNEMRFMVTNLRKGGMFGRGGRFRKEKDGEINNILDKIGFYEVAIDGVKTGEKYIEVDKFILLKEHFAPGQNRFNPIVRAIIDEMRALIKENPEIEALFKRFREKERAYRATRAIELHEILSEAA